MNTFLFGVYPYLCLAVLLVASVVRFDRDPYTWKADSSQLLRRGQLRLGSNLFHLGILGILFGHLGGLLTPLPLFHALGIEPGQKQLLAIFAGGLAGLAMAAGLAILIHRRLTDPRIRASTKAMDWAVLWLLAAQLALGLISLPFSWPHLDGGEMVKLMTWAQGLATLRPDSATLIADVAWVFKLHIVLGFTLLAVAPFSRLVHVWSGFGTLAYLTRSWQLVRARR